MNDLDLFIEKSELVGNENLILSKEEFSLLIKEKQFDYINLPAQNLLKDVRAGQTGFASALVEADYAISETGTIVIDSRNENKRLATCLAEKLMVALPLSRLVATLNHVADFLEERTSDLGGYVAFITGASRTADIERVLTVGVHGPKEMSIYIINDL